MAKMGSANNGVLNVLVTGAAGQISYSLLPRMCNGDIFGTDQHINLRLLDLEPSASAMSGVAMELQDCSFNLVDNIITTVDLEEAFRDVNVAILVGGFPRKEGMLRKDLISKNAPIFKTQGQMIEKFASRDVKVLVVANPANTNCLIAMEHAPSIPRNNFSCLTRLDHERLRSFVVDKLRQQSGLAVSAANVRRCAIWGNHSSTQYPDVTHAEVLQGDQWKLVGPLLNDDNWVRGNLISSVQQRGAAIIQARKLSSAMSAANAIALHLRDWIQGTAQGEIISMGVVSDGNSYGIPNGLVFSFPVKCSKGTYTIVDGLDLSDFSKEAIKKTTKELVQERLDAMDVLSNL